MLEELYKPRRERLALGSVQFGFEYGVANQTGLVEKSAVKSIVQAATDSGMRALDTAISYGGSENALGYCDLTNWEIVTKLPSIPDNCGDVDAWVVGQIEGSLTRLKVNSVHAVLLHSPKQLFSSHGKKLVSAMKLIKEIGYTKKIGVSIYSPTELGNILALDEFEVVQAPLNILDRRLVESGWAQRLRRREVEVHVRSVFVQGLLLMSPAQRPEKFNRWSSIWEKWTSWLELSGLSSVQACLLYALSIREVDRIVVGVDSLAQLQEILLATEGALSDLPQWPEVPNKNLINPARWNYL